VNQFWILDTSLREATPTTSLRDAARTLSTSFGFWIDPDHKGTGLEDFGFWILDLLGTQGALLVPKQSKI
jgi:hypothetical protein